MFLARSSKGGTSSIAGCLEGVSSCGLQLWQIRHPEAGPRGGRGAPCRGPGQKSRLPYRSSRPVQLEGGAASTELHFQISSQAGLRQGCGVAWGCWSWHNNVRRWPPPLSIGKSFLNAGRALPLEVSRLSHCSKAKGHLSASGEQAPGGWKICSPSRLRSLKKSTRWTHLCNDAVQLGPHRASSLEGGKSPEILLALLEAPC